jgi:hypothetical protein
MIDSTFQTILQVLLGVLIWPITNWVKSKLPTVPFLSVVVCYALAIGFTWALSAVVFPPVMPISQVFVVAFALVGTVAQASQAISKSIG